MTVIDHPVSNASDMSSRNARNSTLFFLALTFCWLCLEEVMFSVKDFFMSYSPYCWLCNPLRLLFISIYFRLFRQFNGLFILIMVICRLFVLNDDYFRL